MLHRALRRLLAATTGAALAAGWALAAGTASPAGAATTTDEVYVVPADRVFTFDGRGYGHGYGMSQWGAEHAAALGVSAQQILAFYYPGASLTAAGRPWIRVALTGTGNGSTSVGYGGSGSYRYQCSDLAHAATACTLDVDATKSLVVTDAATGHHPDILTGASRWRVAVAPDGLHVSRLTSGGWKATTFAGKAAVAGPVQFSGSFVRVDYGATQRDYRGIVSAVRTSAPGASPARMVRIDALHLDDYVRGVVYRESPASWPLAALEAQAIASRSYAARMRADSRADGLPYDICDSTYCQVFGGSRRYSGGSSVWLEPDPSSPDSDPVKGTADTLLTSGGQPVYAEFGASNGGWTAGGSTYDTPKYDSWDNHSSDPMHRWTRTVSAASLEARYGFRRLDQLVVTERDGDGAQWGGRVRAVEMRGIGPDGSARTVDLTSQGSLLLGMPSTFWTVRTVSASAPAQANRASWVRVSGWANPGSAVHLQIQPQGASSFATAKTVVAGSSGSYQAYLWLTLDTVVRASSDGATSASRSVDVVGTTASAPASARPGTWVKVTGYAEPGSSVVLHVKQASWSSYRTRPSTTAGARGWWERYFYQGAGTVSYYAVADGQTSAVAVTKALTEA